MPGKKWLGLLFPSLPQPTNQRRELASQALRLPALGGRVPFPSFSFPLSQLPHARRLGLGRDLRETEINAVQIPPNATLRRPTRSNATLSRFHSCPRALLPPTHPRTLLLCPTGLPWPDLGLRPLIQPRV